MSASVLSVFTSPGEQGGDLRMSPSSAPRRDAKAFRRAPARVRRRTDDLLTEVLHSSQPAEVRSEAALALAALGRSSTQVVESLASTLADPEQKVRRAAVLALGRTRDQNAAEP